MQDGAKDHAWRQANMAVLARAQSVRLKALWAKAGLDTKHEIVRGPETGLVTVRGRIGGGGSPFNVGEATVTRTTVRLTSGAVGHAYALGRDREKSRICAIVDALWQDERHQAAISEHIIAPLEHELSADDAKQQAETAATRVDFFTMVRGED